MSNAVTRLLALMQRLRDPLDGCPWDREQTPASLVRHTLEEAYEVADCIEREDWEALPAELGDLLFQVVFQAQIGAEEGRFDFDGIVERLIDKLTRRHPHVFGDEPVLDAAAQTARWEQIKAAERGSASSTLDDVPAALPALTRATKLQQRAARVGFDWPALPPVRAKLSEETTELDAALASGEATAIAHELGDVLFSCVNLARHLGLDAEAALRDANRRFETRFRAIEHAAAARGRSVADLDAAALDALWEEAKREEKKRVPKHP
jgi:ATP diphosphatase